MRVVESLEQMADALSVRRAVFIQEQGVSEAEEIDAFDGDPATVPNAVHVVAYASGVPAATGRLLLNRSTSENARIGRVAVLAAHRRTGLGRGVMLVLQKEAAKRGYPGITLGAQLPAIPFYERLGYTARGGVFLDAGIEHRMMDLQFGGG